ncbi:YjbH domain-containing protein [Tropicibacter alexandrii]|uniref:YjbH domain-containing protein n=1 Tax=Tropicibacter alexandrii TaxID=2267683 RepID=UPI000EF48D0D|nr:YjbH domain-containing protein [Tropicibacter alexandrii]
MGNSRSTARVLIGRLLKASVASVVGLAAGTAAWPETLRDRLTYNTYGVPGLIDMPTAEMPADADLAGTFSTVGGTTRTTLSFQILPRLSGSFRYSTIVDGVTGKVRLYDRSFDLRYQLVTEGDYRPSVVIGLQDFIGTGIYGGEYIVASKTLAPGLKVTGGLGWGRLGSYQAIGSTGSRPALVVGTGGTPTWDQWFRGDVAPFAGLSYAYNDRLKFKLEYSSDDYDYEVTRYNQTKSSPWNFGIDYRFRNGGQLSLYHVRGEEFGAQFTFETNPKTLGVPGGTEAAGLPVAPRQPYAAQDLGWTNDAARQESARATLKQLLEKEGLVAEAVKLEPKRATVRLVNPRYGAEAQAFGRTARAMTRSLPASIEEFVIVPVVNGMPMSAVVMRRSDVERLEHEWAFEMLARTQIVEGYKLAPKPDAGIYPKFEWSLSPFVQLSVFDPDNPVRADGGLRAKAKVELTPNLILTGSVTKKLAGNLDQVTRVDKSNLPRVRTDSARYSAEGDPAIEYLQLAMYGRPGKNLYSRVTVGYLERMYGGASAELLWKPVGSRLALGAELNYVLRRDYDQLFGFQDMTTIDPVTGIAREIPNVNGHVSAYYDFGNGFHGQVDAGRYLAGDYGATFELNREFANGWRVGAYATFTDASFEDFGEGSFDKGIRFTIPLASFMGTPSRTENAVTIQSLSRDGGARLNVNGRLYGQVRDYHEAEVVDSWGRFWR